VRQSRLDKLLYRRSVLIEKIKAYERARKALNELVNEFIGNTYALEALNAIDRNISNDIMEMYLSLKTIDDKIKELQREEQKK